MAAACGEAFLALLGARGAASDEAAAGTVSTASAVSSILTLSSTSKSPDETAALLSRSGRRWLTWAEAEAALGARVALLGARDKEGAAARAVTAPDSLEDEDDDCAKPLRWTKSTRAALSSGLCHTVFFVRLLF